MIVWFPLLKLVVSLLLIWLAWMPIGKHIASYKERERQARIDGTVMERDDTYWPRDGKKYLPLLAVILIITMSPFKLQSTQDSERTVRTYDSTTSAPPPYIEREARQQYKPQDNESVIRQIMKEESK